MRVWRESFACVVHSVLGQADPAKIGSEWLASLGASTGVVQYDEHHLFTQKSQPVLWREGFAVDALVSGTQAQSTFRASQHSM
eukprot:856257-Amphidinium_carterae.1